MQLIDLSQIISPTMPMFSKIAPRPTINAWLSHEQARDSGNYEDCSCEISQVEFLTSAGTYMDSPYHFNPHGKQIHELDLQQLVLPGVVVDCTDVEPRQSIEPAVLDGLDIAGKAVLFRTDWSQYWGQPKYGEFPFLSEGTALALKEGGAKLAGVDFLVIDDTQNPRRPVHVILLNANILIVENLTNLAELPDTNFIFQAVPVKFAGAAAFPVRAFAMINA